MKSEPSVFEPNRGVPASKADQQRAERLVGEDRAEAFIHRLQATGDTPHSFMIKGALGLAQIAVVLLLAGWLLVVVVRWLIRLLFG